MDGYCHRCGVFALLSLVTYWCRPCTEAWVPVKSLADLSMGFRWPGV